MTLKNFLEILSIEITGQNNLRINNVLQNCNRSLSRHMSFESSLADYPLAFPDPLMKEEL